MRRLPTLLFLAIPVLAANCADSRDVKLINGKIATMDKSNTHEEDKMGTIEPGEFGDLVVLSSDYFDPKQVSDDAIKHITSVPTVVDGKVVHDTLHDTRKAGR